MDVRSFVTHLECSATGERHDADALHGLSRAGAPLLVRYDLAAVKGALDKKMLAGRAADMWRLGELLPVRRAADIVSLGEAATPLIRLGSGSLLVKDEGRLPTGSFKARGMAVAVTMAKAFGVTRAAVPTAGNAGAALAAYGSRAGMETFVFTPDDTPEVTVREIAYQGARVYRVNGLVNHCRKLVRDGAGAMGWFDFSTLKEPYRIEGKKTMGLELAEQLGWTLPDVIYYPTGGGTGFIGMWKAFEELAAIGFIGARRPRMVAVQSTGCGPIVRAFEAGAETVAEPWDPVDTDMHGVRVPKPIGDRLILRVIRESGGHAVAVSDAAAAEARARVARRHGLHLCPEGALCLAAHEGDLAAGRVTAGERVVVFNTASGLKSPMPPTTLNIDWDKPVDWSALEKPHNPGAC